MSTGAIRYGYCGDGYPHSAHRRILDTVGRDRRVLDVGCASGYLAERFKQNGCRVTGIEVDAEAAERARHACDEVVVGSIEEEATWKRVQGPFDAIICADVLEHVASPEAILRRLPSLLSPGGEIVVSLPNIAYVKIRVSLLLGRFDYTEAGILDRTHLKFYTRASATRFFRDAGFEVLQCLPAVGRMPYFVARVWPTLLAPQFVFRLRPLRYPT